MKTLTNFNKTPLHSINFKTIFSFIVLVCFTQTGFGQTTVTYDFSSSGAVTGLNETSPGISIDANIGFGSFKNSGTADPALTSGQLRLYQNATRGGSIKVYANNGVTITEVVVRASSVTGPAGYDADGVFQSNLTDGTTYTMSGLSATSTVEFFQRSSSSSNRIYVDEIEITYTSGGATPTCPDPASLAASGETATTVDLAWTAGGTESLWNIEVYEQGADTSTATPVYTETGVNTNSTTATGLTFGGDYTAYVQADCGATDGVSDWIASNDFSLEYCESTPTSNDNDGISNVQLGTTDFPTGDVTYADYRDTVVDLELGNTANLQVTFETDFDYHTNVWIDFNDNLVFESTELVFVGESADLPITTLDASFDIAIDAAQGTHYMRIGTADMGQSTPNPCYDGTYGVTIDMAINIIIGGGCTALTTWDGTAWSNGVPDANSYAVISGAYSTGTDGAITACVMKADADVTIDGATDAAISEVLVETGNTLTIDETSSLTVSGDFTNTGTVTLNSTEDDFSSLIVEGTATGDITYNRYVNSYDTNPGGGGWDLVGAPAGMTIADFITANGDNIKVLGDNYAFGPYDNAAGQWNLYATTTTNTCTTGGTETFTDIGSGSGYDDRSWTGDDGSTWTATNAIDGQTITGAAITLNRNTANTYVQSGTISGGICNITISTKRPFGSGSGTLDVLINGSSVGTVPYSGSVQTTTISDINITGDIVIRIDNNIGGSNGGGFERVTIDDVTWTANTAQDLGSFTTSQGYAMATNTGDGATVAFTGTIQTTSQSINVINNDAANEGAGRKWNLVSNPFPSYINGNTAAQATNNFLEANSSVFESEYIAVYGWSGTAWSIYNQLTGAFSMAPGQAFWISAASTSEVTLDFTAAMRTTTGTGDFIAGPQLLTYNVELILKDESKKATTGFYFRDGLSLDLDPGYDAGAYNQSMALSTRLAWGSQETAFSINAMGMEAMQNTRVPLEIRQNAGQAFTISIADMELPQDIYVYLEDTLNGTLTSLKENDFELTAQSDLSGADRFFIVFKSNSVLSSGDTLGINALNVFKANNDDFVTIAGITPDLGQLDVSLYNILGQTVREKALNPTTATQTISTQGLASGLYIVQIRSGNQTTIKKIIVK